MSALRPQAKRLHGRKRRGQQGISLIVGMIMLVIITVMVTTAFRLSTTNAQAVGNMQFRDEAIAAANKGIEQAMSTILTTGFTTLPAAASSYTLDINNDGTPEYTISIGIPACVQSTTITGAGPTGGSSASLGSGFAASTTYYSTLWDVAATVTDAVSGTSIEIHQGVRIALDATQKPLVCAGP